MFITDYRSTKILSAAVLTLNKSSLGDCGFLVRRARNYRMVALIWLAAAKRGMAGGLLPLVIYPSCNYFVERTGNLLFLS